MWIISIREITGSQMLRWRYCGKLTSVVKWSWCLCVHKCGSLCRSMRRPCEMNQHDSTASDSRAFAEQLTTQHSVSWWSLFDSKFDHTPPWHPGSAGEFWCHQVQMYRQRWKQNKTKKETAGCPPPPRQPPSRFNRINSYQIQSDPLRRFIWSRAAK